MTSGVCVRRVQNKHIRAYYKSLVACVVISSAGVGARVAANCEMDNGRHHAVMKAVSTEEVDEKSSATEGLDED